MISFLCFGHLPAHNILEPDILGVMKFNTIILFMKKQTLKRAEISPQAIKDKIFCLPICISVIHQTCFSDLQPTETKHELNIIWELPEICYYGKLFCSGEPNK